MLLNEQVYLYASFENGCDVTACFMLGRTETQVNQPNMTCDLCNILSDSQTMTMINNHHI